MPSITNMKAHLKKTLALAILAATLPAQGNDHTAALQRAQLLEQQEGDLAAAQTAYTALLDDAKAPPAVHQAAYWHLASLEWQIGKRDDARDMLGKVVAGGGAFADAAKTLLQSDSQEAQGKQERVERARAILKRIAEVYGKADTQHLVTGLHQLGNAAAQAIVEQLNVGPALRNDGNRLNKQPLLQFYVLQLWEIGTEPAQQFLLDAAANGPLPWQRFLTPGYTGHEVAADLAPALRQFTQTNDPTREVWLNATKMLVGLDAEAIAECLASRNANTRESGLVELARRWSLMNSNAAASPFLDKHLATLRSAFDYQDSRRQKATWDLMAKFLEIGPEDASIVALQELQKGRIGCARQPTLRALSAMSPAMRNDPRTSPSSGLSTFKNRRGLRHR